MAKIFILGIGAQRTGSTWLHSQLKRDKRIRLGLCKEHHIFDTLFTPYFPHRRSELSAKIEMSRKLGKSIRKELKLLSFLENPESYFDYFDRLHSRDPETEAVGDLTPSYSMLDAKAYSFIRNGLQARGFDIKVIFVMRDPVERIWSMLHQASKVRKAELAGEQRVLDIQAFTNPHASMRTRYDRTITELEKSFPSESIFYEFYERLFRPEVFDRLGNHLELSLAEPDFRTVKNPSMSKGELNGVLAKKVAKHYECTYRFIQQRFGDQITDLWPGYRNLESFEPGSTFPGGEL